MRDERACELIHEQSTWVEADERQIIGVCQGPGFTAQKMDQAMRYDRRYIGVDLENPDFVAAENAMNVAIERNAHSRR